MPTSQPTCVSQIDLARFVHGDLDAGRLEQIAQHVDTCSPCQETVVALAEQSDTFADALQKAGAQQPEAQENDLRAGIKRIVQSLRVDQAAEPHPTASGMPQQLGPYRIEQRLGTGGMGHVYRATHTKLKRSVALKVLPNHRWLAAGTVSRFEREMEAIGSLDHPNIVGASDAGEDQGMHYLVMEFVEGLDLSRLVSRIGPLAVADATELARQTAVGLHHAHESGLVHRDIKPSNLMLAWDRSSGRAPNSHTTLKILDLGLALLGDEHLQEGHELTTVGTLMGTLDYISPEQGVDSHSVDCRTDIYSLGATLFKLLTGRAPYADPELSTLMKKMTALATKPAPSIGVVRPDLPQDLVQVVDRMLARDPDDRYASAGEVAADLAPFTGNADLVQLLRRGLKADDPEGGATIAVPTQALAGQARNLAKPDPASSRWTTRSIAVAISLLAFLGVAGGILFQIATDYGNLVIRSDDPNAKVIVKQADETVQEFRLTSGEDSLRLRTGDYDLEVVGDAELSIEPRSIAVRRGQKSAANVSNAQANPPAAAADVVAYEGDTWWPLSESNTMLAVPTGPTDLQRLRAEEALLSEQFGKDHPRRKAIERQIANVTQMQIEDELEKDPEYFSLRQQINQYTDELQRLSDLGRPDAEELDVVRQELRRLEIERMALAAELRPRIAARRKEEITADSEVAIRVLGTHPERPIDGVFALEPSGSVHLGPGYGRVKILGMTFEEAEQTIQTHLQKELQSAEVMVTLPRRTSGSESRFSVEEPVQDLAYYLDVMHKHHEFDKLSEALQAVQRLGQPHSGQAARAVLSLMRTPRHEALPIYAMDALEAFDSQAVVDAVLEEFDQGNARSRDFLLGFFMRLSTANSIGDRQRLRDLFRKHGSEVAQARLRNPEESDLENATIGQFLLLLATEFDVNPNDVPFMVAAMIEEVERGNARAAIVLARHAPETPGLAKRIAEMALHFMTGGHAGNAPAGVSWHDCRQAIGRLGKHAEPIVEELNVILNTGLTAAGYQSTFINLSSLRDYIPIIQTLGKIGPKAEATADVLQNFVQFTEKRGEVADVHRAAKEALDRITVYGK